MAVNPKCCSFSFQFKGDEVHIRKTISLVCNVLFNAVI